MVGTDVMDLCIDVSMRSPGSIVGCQVVGRMRIASGDC